MSQLLEPIIISILCIYLFWLETRVTKLEEKIKNKNQEGS